MATSTAASEAGLTAVAEAVRGGHLKAGGPATSRCEAAMRDLLGAPAVLMTQSCTAALELAAGLLEIGPGDEVIMPSFAFASAANAFVLRGATPVFVDVDPATMNIDPGAVEAAVTSRTRAIVAVHYAGVAADLPQLTALAERHGLALVEDAAHAIGASFEGRALGTIGALGVMSFDATKNVSCGSGGALLVNEPTLVRRAEVLRDYGTDRARFRRGEVARYRWVDVGANAAMNELAAAYLWPQLANVRETTQRRLRTWHRYDEALAPVEHAGLVRRLAVPRGCEHNGHVYALVLPSARERERVRSALGRMGVEATFHYVPLHSAPAGLAFGRTHGTLRHTDELSARLLRLPLHAALSDAEVEHVIAAVLQSLPVEAGAQG